MDSSGALSAEDGKGGIDVGLDGVYCDGADDSDKRISIVGKGGTDVGMRGISRDFMLVRSAFFDFLRELCATAMARAEECARRAENYSEGCYDFKLGMLPGACDEQEFDDEMLALHFTTVVQGWHFDGDRIPSVGRRGQGSCTRSSSWAPADSRVVLIVKAPGDIYFAPL